MPTKTFQANFDLATNAYAEFKGGLEAYLQKLKEYEAALEAAGAPYTRGKRN
jgi:hypothetical protein